MQRRDFLRLTGAAAGTGLGMLSFVPDVFGSPFGQFPAASASRILPDGVRAKRVLEIFLYGGLSPWETLYFVPEYGQPSDPTYPNQQFYTFGGTGFDSVAYAMNQCGGNQTRAARALGISRNTLLARLDAYGLPRPRKP